MSRPTNRARVRARIAAAVFAALIGGARGESRAAAPAGVAPIQDNSFLVEEAYNQEPGVVQHVGTWSRFEPGGDYEYAFTQEWPLLSQRHQLSFTIPRLSRGDAGRRTDGWGDIELRYRYQLLGIGGAKLAAAPSFALMLPTGDAGGEMGAGAVGGALGVPLSVEVTRRFVAHSNLGIAYAGESSGLPATFEYGVGQSLVWLARPRFNPLIELKWSRAEPVGSGSSGGVEESFLVSPGFRWAYDSPSGLQIAPGIAFPIGLGAQGGDSGVFLYLSFEHEF